MSVEVGVGMSGALGVVLMVLVVILGSLLRIVVSVIEGVGCQGRQLLRRVEHVLGVLVLHVVRDVVKRVALGLAVMDW